MMFMSKLASQSDVPSCHSTFNSVGKRTKVVPLKFLMFVARGDNINDVVHVVGCTMYTEFV